MSDFLLVGFMAHIIYRNLCNIFIFKERKKNMKEPFKKYYGFNSQKKRSQAAIPVSDEETTKIEREGLILGTYGGVDYVKGERIWKKKD